MRRIAPLLLLPLLSLAADENQIAWVGDWDAAFKQAKAENKPVMLCINSLDKESANRRAATKTYRDAAFVKATRDFVMIVVSTELHAASGPCPRFGRITCLDHQNCYKELKARHGEAFYNKSVKGEMISPQHAWFRPDGTLLRRKEYELTQSELLARMRAALAEITGKEAAPDAGEEPPGDGEPGDKNRPLDDREKAELERAQKPGREEADREGRRAALANLLAGEKVAAHAALVELLQTAKPEVRCDILRAFGQANVVAVLEAIHERLERDKEDDVRSFAAVALERLAQEASIEPLIKRARKEKDTRVRKNVMRALGACGGGAKSKDAAKVLLKAIASDKQEIVRTGAAFGCVFFRGAAAPLVLKKLEGYALKLKDPVVRGAVVYALAYIGNEETTLPVLEKLRDEYKGSKNRQDEWRLTFVRSAIRMLKGEGGDFGRSAWFLFRDDRDDPARQ